MRVRARRSTDPRVVTTALAATLLLVAGLVSAAAPAATAAEPTGSSAAEPTGAAPTAAAGGSAAVASSSAPLSMPTAAAPAVGTFRPVGPTRLYDSRSTHHQPTGGRSLSLAVLGQGGVPSSGVGAVLIHVTLANTTRLGYVTVYPGGTARPATSTVNYAPANPSANSAVVRPGPSGDLLFYDSAGGADLIVDVLGYYVGGSQPAAGGVATVRPQRVIDTRSGHRKVGAELDVAMTGATGVPANAAAVLVNLTTVDASASSRPVTAWASGSPRPATSNGNTVRGQPTANLLMVKLGSRGRIAVGVGGGTADVILDLIGYVASSAATYSGLTTVPPARLVDTRRTRTPVGTARSLLVKAGGGHGVPADATAAVVTITSVPGRTSTGALTAWANGTSRPATSDVNARPDVAVAQQVIVTLGPDGAFALGRNTGLGDVVIDVVGYVRAAVVPTVVPTVLSTTDLSPLSGSLSATDATSLNVLQTANRYALRTWWPGAGQQLLAAPMTSSATLVTDGIRRLSMEAFSLAVSLRTGAYSASVTGVSAASATAVVRQIVSRVSCGYRASSVGGWGESWQSSLWSSYAGRAAWLVWDALDARTQTCVSRMVVSEADYVSTLRPKYLADASGRLLSPGDTGGEEDSWYALAPALAIAMMPTAERRDIWRLAEERMLIASWSKPSDLTSSTAVDGVPLSGWLAGSNVSEAGVVVNHNRVAPDYTTNGYQNVDTAVFAALAGQPVPQASLTGLATIYAALSSQSYLSPPFAAPGGPVYSSGSAIYYPQGCDWGTGQELPYALLDVDAEVFAFDGRPSGELTPTASASSAALSHLQAAAAMQRVTPDGREYHSAAEYRYVGAEEHAGQLAAQIYLASFTAERLNVDVTPIVVNTPSLSRAVAQHAPPRALSEDRLKH
ncbi:MAG: hypothetical protein JWO63_2034 [Frankiales bacterium]|nr:hypothetical protein [Frankiales bacterium]